MIGRLCACPQRAGVPAWLRRGPAIRLALFAALVLVLTRALPCSAGLRHAEARSLLPSAPQGGEGEVSREDSEGGPAGADSTPQDLELTHGWQFRDRLV